MIKYLGEISPPNRSIIPAFSTLSSSFSVIAWSRHTIYGLHRDYASPTLSSQQPPGVSRALRNMSYQIASSNFCNFKYFLHLQMPKGLGSKHYRSRGKGWEPFLLHIASSQTTCISFRNLPKHLSKQRTFSLFRVPCWIS